MLPYDDVILENGLADKPVLLSERTLQFLLMAMSKIELRRVWDSMEDATWDELSDYIAQAETEILTEQAANVATYHEAERTTTQAIAANTQTAIVWDTGGSPPLFSFVTVPVTGKAIVSFRVNVQSAVAATKTAILIHNGVEIARDDIRVNTAQQFQHLTHVMGVDAGDTFRLDVLCPQALTVKVDTYTPKLSMVIV